MWCSSLLGYLFTLLLALGSCDEDREAPRFANRMIPVLLRQEGCRRPIVNTGKSCTACNDDLSCSNGGTCCPKTVTKIKPKPMGQTCKQSSAKCTKYNPNNAFVTNLNKTCICGTTKFCCTPGSGATTAPMPVTSEPTTVPMTEPTSAPTIPDTMPTTV